MSGIQLLKLEKFLILFMIAFPLLARGHQDGTGNNIKQNRIVKHKITDESALFIFNDTNSDQKIYAHISFPFEDAVRIQAKKEQSQTESGQSNKFTCDESDNAFELRTTHLRVAIQKSPFQLSIYRNNNEFVFSTISGINSNIMPDGDDIRLNFASAIRPDEKFYGFGEKFNGLNQRGNKVVMEIDDAYMSTDGRTYKSIPFFISSAKYGLLVNSALPVIFHMGDKENDAFSVDIPDSEMDVFVFANKNPLEIIKQYTSVTGRPPLIPQWSLEPWLSRRGMTGWNNTATAEADVDMILKDSFPLGVILWEGVRRQFGRKQTPDMNQLVNKWHSLGIKQVFWSYTGHINPNSDMVKKTNPDFFVRSADSLFCLGGFGGGYAYIDPTNPEAMEWWKETMYAPYLKSQNNQSAPEYGNMDGIKIDFSELFPKYESPLLMKKQVKGIKNLHSVYFSEQIYDWLQQIKPEGGITWVRGGGLGLQRVGFAWGGDRGRTFPQLRGTVSASLSLSICGVALNGHDLGGYRGGDDPYAREVYIRGVQFAAFSPSFHDHGSSVAPWEQDEYGWENYKFYARIRYNLLPYLYHYVNLAHETGVPIMRSLFLHYPDDVKTLALEDEYLLGDDLLVAPILAAGFSRQIYLPKDNWIDFWTNVEYTGGQNLTYTCPLNRIPVFVKSNSIIPIALNDAMDIGGQFKQSQKNDLLLSFLLYDCKDSELLCHGKNGTIHVSAKSKDSDLDIHVSDIKEDFGLRVLDNEPNSIVVNEQVLPNIGNENFENADSGWFFDEKNGHCLIKIAHQVGESGYSIELKGITANSKKVNSIQRHAFSGTPPASPEIKHVDAWDQSLDVYFKPVEKATSFVLKHGTQKDTLTNSVRTTTSPVTIRNVENDSLYYVSVSAINEWGISDGKVMGPYKPKAGRKPVFQFNEDQLFIRGNHFIERNTTIPENRILVYAIKSQQEKKCQIWIKARKNIGHHKYFRWYNLGEIVLKSGTSSLNLRVKGENIDLDKLFLTTAKGNRPLLQDENEAEYNEMTGNFIADEMINVEFQ